MRFVNHLPPLNRRRAEAQARYRGAGRDGRTLVLAALILPLLAPWSS
jgi:hypothetical protein